MGKRRDFKIIYEDNHLLVVEKPPNMLTQGDQTGDEDLLTILKEDIRQRYNKPGSVFLGLVHRLDRPVGGIMVFAKTSKAASRLSEQIRTGEFDKTYLAVVHGVPDMLSGTLVNYLVKDEKTNTVRVADIPADKDCYSSRDHCSFNDNNPSKGHFSSGSAKKAVLDYTVKGSAGAVDAVGAVHADGSAGGYSLVSIRLHTGRPHQIRVQFAAIGHPLYGDQKYGALLNKPGMQLALWSVEIGFIHPTLREHISFSSAPPPVYPWNLFK